MTCSKKQQREFIHPCDDPQVIAGQVTIALEFVRKAARPIDYLFLPVGGGGTARIIRLLSKRIKRAPWPVSNFQSVNLMGLSSSSPTSIDPEPGISDIL